MWYTIGITFKGNGVGHTGMPRGAGEEFAPTLGLPATGLPCVVYEVPERR
jgi:hypothetical protein